MPFDLLGPPLKSWDDGVEVDEATHRQVVELALAQMPSSTGSFWQPVRLEFRNGPKPLAGPRITRLDWVPQKHTVTKHLKPKS
ncbi:MAG: hypothetical protein AAGF59_15610 [Pseudomonadota bacterium]